MNKTRIGIFASGSGTNAENIFNYFKNSDIAEIALVLCNNESAGVIERAGRAGVKVYLFDREQFNKGEVLNTVIKHKVDFIVLAGFLWLMPSDITASYKNRIINIHPALLPKYGGKGMYGMNVHNAVVKNGEKESGITIHWVNDEYDKGDIIFQAKCNINAGDTPEEVAQRVHKLEYEHFPQIIEKLIKEL